MRLDDSPESDNVEDRRGMKKAGLAIGGGAGVIVLIIAAVLGLDPNKLPIPVGGPPPGGGGVGAQKGEPPKDGYKQFASRILGLTEEVWTEQFRANKYGAYEKPKMVLFSEAVDTKGCGSAPSAVGPFYCPADRTVYLDPTFFNELEKLGGSKAEFSQAYVIGHEVGHHVQNLRGYSDRADRMRKTPRENEFSIRLELQADYLAGVWAHHAEKKRKILERGDVEKAMQTARSIGDNRLQEKMKGRSWPESFNHGTDKQRYGAFLTGFNTGDASKRTLDAFFDDTATPFDRKTGELQNTALFGR